MKNLSNFINSALTRAEMKNVNGGGCRVCSELPSNYQGDLEPGSGTCGPWNLTRDDAFSIAIEQNSSDDPYVYSYECQ